jgi:predicted small integral membrane protein
LDKELTEVNYILISKSRSYVVLGGFGVIMSVCYFMASLQLPFGKIDMPGAALFPVFSSVVLLIASITTIWEGYSMDRSEKVNLPLGPSLRRLLYFISLLAAYLVALPWVGDMIAGTTFAGLLILVLSKIGWKRSVTYALIMAVTIHVIFVIILKVPMPRGVLFQ